MILFDLQSNHTLDSVGAENYIRYGANGPSRYIGHTRSERNAAPQRLPVHLALHTTEETPNQTIAELVLERKDHVLERHTLWQGESSDGQLHLLWMWDFYRMTSFLHLRLVADHADDVVDDYRALLSAKPPAALHLTVTTASGQIQQIHTYSSNITQ